MVDYDEKDNRLLSNALLSTSEEEDGMCSICLVKYDGTTTVVTTLCKHSFHSECIDLWLEGNNTCPNCRMDLKARPMPCSKKTCICIGGFTITAITTVLCVVFKS